MISFTGLVFSITIVVLQLTSCQFSPRVLRSFLRDRFNQLAPGVFVAMFVYALLVLRSVRGTAQVYPFVPQMVVTSAFVFVLASVGVYVRYIHHIDPAAGAVPRRNAARVSSLPLGQDPDQDPVVFGLHNLDEVAGQRPATASRTGGPVGVRRAELRAA